MAYAQRASLLGKRPSKTCYLQATASSADLPFGNIPINLGEVGWGCGDRGAENVDFPCFGHWVAPWEPKKVRTICVKTLSSILT